jgi:hypothetical protein
MTTTKRYPKDPRTLDLEDFIDWGPSGRYRVIVHEQCHNCTTPLGDVGGQFLPFWRDAANPNDSAVWCDSCVDEPDEVN